MSVFREKNGSVDGANPLFESAGARCAPAGSTFLSHSVEDKRHTLKHIHTAFSTTKVIHYLQSEKGVIYRILQADPLGERR